MPTPPDVAERSAARSRWDRLISQKPGRASRIFSAARSAGSWSKKKLIRRGHLNSWHDLPTERRHEGVDGPRLGEAGLAPRRRKTILNVRFLPSHAPSLAPRR